MNMNSSEAKGNRLLIVEDDIALADVMQAFLEQEGCRVTVLHSGEEAVQVISEQQPDLVILDWMLPGTTGIELARRLKKDEGTSEIPIIMLTAKTEEDNKIQGLEIGADDYITKPFSPRELVARLKAVLRRATPQGKETPIDVDDLILDPVGHRVTSDGQPLTMGPTEYRLLQFFMTHQDRVYTRTQLLDHVWGGNVYVEERTVDVHIRRLRKALGSRHEHLIQTVRGAGYRFSTKVA